MLGIMTFGIKIKTEFLTVFKSVKVFQFSNLSVSVLRYKEHLLPPLKPKSQTLLAEFIPSLKEWVYPAKSQHSNDLIQLATLLCCSVLEAYFNTILLMCLLALSFHYFFQSDRVFHDYFYNGRPNTQNPQALREEAEDMPGQ